MVAAGQLAESTTDDRDGKVNDVQYWNFGKEMALSLLERISS
jgi:hypothetical protein